MEGRKQEFKLFRHPQSRTNQNEIHQAGNQFETDGLTDYGRRQGEQAAEALRHAGVELIVTSTYLRCRQFADLIHGTTNAPVVAPIIKRGQPVTKEVGEVMADDLSLLRETDNPTELAGLAYNDPVAQEVKSAIEEQALEQDWRYSDEENYFDQWNRVAKIENYLRSITEDRIVVISHGGILKMLLYYIRTGSNSFVPLEHKLSIYLDDIKGVDWFDNAGYVPLNRIDGRRWQLITSHNEHLGTRLGVPEKWRPQESARPSTYIED